MTGLWLVIVAAGAGLVGLAEALRAVVMRSRERHAADDWLRSATGSAVPKRYEWRAAQLLAGCERLRLAQTLRLIVWRSVERPPGAHGALPTAGLAEHRDSMRLLASRLERIDQPVTPAGILRVVDLITDGTGPLWSSRRSEALGEAISSTLAVLTPERFDPFEQDRAA